MGNVKLFESKSIRSVWVESERKWYFSVHDVIEALTDSTDPRQYVKKMRSRDSILAGNWGTICTQVEMVAIDGKRRQTKAANTLKTVLHHPTVEIPTVIDKPLEAYT